MRTGLFALVAVLLACLAAPAAGAQRKLAVLELADSAALDEGAVRFLAERVRGEAAALPREAWLVMTRENLLALLPPGTDLADCEGECEVETGRNIGADVVVSGEIVRLGDDLKVTLRAHETTGGTLLGQEVASAASEGALEGEVAAAARRLLLRVHEPDGPRGTATLRLRAPEGLEVLVNGVRIGVTPLPEQRLDAGAHRVEVESRCHQRLRVPVELAPDEARTLDLAPRARLTRLRVDAHTPDGDAVAAVVIVDGQTLGDTPGDFEVPVCARKLEVIGAGATWSDRLDLREGTPAGVTATLGDRPAPAPEAVATVRDTGWDTGTWLVLGGAAALGLGAAIAVQNNEDGAALRHDPGNQQLRDEVDASYKASLVLYVGGGLSVATGLLLWLLADDAQDQAAVGVGVGPGSVTIGGAW